MKTLDEHNREILQKRAEAVKRAQLAGVSCPKCNAEMYYSALNVLMASIRTVHCECGYHGEMYG